MLPTAIYGRRRLDPAILFTSPTDYAKSLPPLLFLPYSHERSVGQPACGCDFIAKHHVVVYTAGSKAKSDGLQCGMDGRPDSIGAGLTVRSVLHVGSPASGEELGHYSREPLIG